MNLSRKFKLNPKPRKLDLAVDGGEAVSQNTVYKLVSPQKLNIFFNPFSWNPGCAIADPAGGFRPIPFGVMTKDLVMEDFDTISQLAFWIKEGMLPDGMVSASLTYGIWADDPKEDLAYLVLNLYDDTTYD